MIAHENDPPRKRLNQALAIFGHPEHSSFNPEKARAYYKKGRVLTLQGQSGEAETAYGEAMKLYKKIRPNDPRPREQLDDSDFDKCIMFWSR
jgi:hypothetical protein